MKLMMPNPYSIYLHDTPAQSLFERDVRAFSHGCVRVGDALGLATALLEAQSGWNRKKVDALVAAGRTVTVPLDRQIPVYVTYFTARSEEHTSELQSLMRISYAVFCLKKKKIRRQDTTTLSTL